MSDGASQGADMEKAFRLEDLQPKPRTTVKRFALDLKARIERAAVAFDQPGQVLRTRLDGKRALA